MFSQIFITTADEVRHLPEMIKKKIIPEADTSLHLACRMFFSEGITISSMASQLNHSLQEKEEAVMKANQRTNFAVIRKLLSFKYE